MSATITSVPPWIGSASGCSAFSSSASASERGVRISTGELYGSSAVSHDPAVTYSDATVVTMDAAGTEHERGWIRIEDGLIAELGAGDPPGPAESLGGAVITPGLVNTHHHLYQTLTRARAQDADLFTWLRTLYPGLGADRRRDALRGRPDRASPSSRCRAARPSSTTTTSSRAASRA